MYEKYSFENEIENQKMTSIKVILPTLQLYSFCSINCIHISTKKVKNKKIHHCNAIKLVRLAIHLKLFSDGFVILGGGDSPSFCNTYISETTRLQILIRWLQIVTTYNSNRVL